MKILVKFPTRERPQKFEKVICSYATMSSGQDVEYFATIDSDDPMLAEYEQVMRRNPWIRYTVGKSGSKIAAVNRDMDMSGDWDILLLASDDMTCNHHYWDTVIRSSMTQRFPDLDGCLWFNDGHVGMKLCTMPIMGRKWYQRFDYIYNPEYLSLWCDNEQTEVAQRLDKIAYSGTCLFRHDHPAWDSKVSNDPLYHRNNTLYKRDEEVYRRRKSINFGL